MNALLLLVPISTDVVQSLADGNRIERHTASSVARDGQGRVRREQQLTAIGGILPQVDGRIISPRRISFRSPRITRWKPCLRSATRRFSASRPPRSARLERRLTIGA